MKRSVARGRRGFWLLLLVVAAPETLAQSVQDIYVTRGEHGEVSFSDVAQPGARRVTVETADPLEDPLAELDRRIAQTLSVADSLEASRLARERARSEAREAARARQAASAEARSGTDVDYQDRYVYPPYLYPPFRDPHGRPHDGPNRPPPEPEPLPQERTRAFPARD